MDDYAQGLRRLFYRAHPKVQQGSSEAEVMGRTVLAYQFVVGLLPEIKRKIAGIEGDFKQLLTRARFEEVKLRELPAPQQRTPQSRPNMVLNQESPKGQSVRRDGAPRSQGQQERAVGAGHCFNCGATGHIARNCRWCGSGSSEAQGRTQPPNKQGKIAALVAREDQEGIEADRCSNPLMMWVWHWIE